MIESHIEDWYLARWGEPSRRAEFRMGGLRISVLKWDVSVHPEGVNLYASVGASAAAGSVAASADHRVEFISGLIPAVDELAEPLASIALAHAQGKIAMQDGDTFAYGAPLWRTTHMDRLLTLRQRAEIIPPLRLDSGLHVEFMQAIPVFRSEVTFISEHGIDALIDAWQAAGVRYWDPQRSAMSTSPI